MTEVTEMKPTIKMKSSFCAFIAAMIIGIGLNSATCRAQGFGGGEMPKGAEKIIAIFTELLQHRFTPTIKSASVGSATVGKPISVSVRAAHEDERSEDKVAAVEVYYSTDGGKWFQGPVALKQSEKDAELWSGSIPAIAKSGKVIFYPRVIDTYGNVTVEIPCKVSSEDFPPAADGCMAFAAADAAPYDDPPGLVDDNYDIWGIRVGMDDSKFHININVEGSIYKGNLQQQMISAYTALVIDTQKLYEIEDIMSFVMPSGEKEPKAPDFAHMLIYAPMAKIMGGNFSDCGVFRMKDKSPMIDAANMKCDSSGPDLFMSLDKKILKGNMRNSFTMVGGMTGYMSAGGSSPMPIFQDFARATRVSFKERSFNVN